MAFPGIDENVEQFVLSWLSTGTVLSAPAFELSESLPSDAYPGEQPIAVVLEMLCGSIATALHADDMDDVVRATELMELAHR